MLGISTASTLGDPDKAERFGLTDCGRDGSAVHPVFHKVIGCDGEPPIVIPGVVASSISMRDMTMCADRDSTR